MIKVVVEKRSPTKYSYHFYENAEKMTYKDGIKNLYFNEDFQKFVTKLIRDAPFKGFIWKLTALNRTLDFDRNDKYFKFTIEDNKKLYSRKADSTRFDQYLNDSNYDVSSSLNKEKPMFSFFESLSGNGMLVPKKETSNEEAYVHFPNFIRKAPKKQINEFWRIFASLIYKKFTDKSSKKTKLYINTHGLDVPWLHVRFDKVPDKIIWNHSFSKKSRKKTEKKSKK